MRIGLYIKQLDPKIGGGFSFEDEVLKGILSNKNKSKHEFIVISDWHCVELKNYLEYHGVKYFTLSRFKLVSKIRKACLILREKIVTVVPLKIDAKSWLVKQLEKLGIKLIVSLSPRILTYEIPYFIANWDLEHLKQPFFPEVSSGGIWPDREEFYSNALKRAAGIIVGTEANKIEVIHFYKANPERIKVINFPVRDFSNNKNDIDIFSKYGLPKEFVFYPAQFWAHKNHITLIKALRMLKDNFGYELPVVFTGSDKGNYSYVEKFAADLNISNLIIYLGFVSEDDLGEIYKSALALTFVSLFGPENLPPLEAMLLGCPVIAHKTDGSIEQLGDGAILVNALDAYEIANQINKIKQDATFRQNLIIRGRKRIMSLTSTSYVERLDACFDEFETIRDLWQ